MARVELDSMKEGGESPPLSFTTGPAQGQTATPSGDP